MSWYYKDYDCDKKRDYHCKRGNCCPLCCICGLLSCICGCCKRPCPMPKPRPCYRPCKRRYFCIEKSQNKCIYD